MKPNPIAPEFKSDHLFLLIGTNPLPNYVAARLLLKPGGTLCLVHSGETNGTGAAANRLQKLLVAEQVIPAAMMLQVDEASAADVYDKVSSAAQNINKAAMGLHYTGGTKVMAVHAHRALQDTAAARSLTLPVCSYLDARSYKMMFDPVGVNRPAGEAVLLAVQLALKDLLKLHDIELKPNSPVKEPTLTNSAKELLKLHANQTNAKQWRDWCNGELRAKARTLQNNWQGETKLAKLSLTWPTDTVFASLVEAISKELAVPVAAKVDLAAPGIEQKFGKIRHFCGWLDGLWLEHAVLDQIIQIATASDLADYGLNLDTDRGKIPFDFEFDVAAMRGYQLFGISCSTVSKKTDAKSKLFEAYIRAHQLGGDEARVGLVSGYPEPKSLEKEIENAWDAKGKLKVFGPNDFLNLKEHLAAWFTQAPPWKG